MTQLYNEEDMGSGASECYGCSNMTMNMSGMCNECGGDNEDYGKHADRVRKHINRHPKKALQVFRKLKFIEQGGHTQ